MRYPGRGRAPGASRIFVMIPSYRDVECQWTVRDLFERADRPGDVTVGICWQFDPAVDGDCFEIETRFDQVRTSFVHARHSRGLGWARAEAWKLWQGEEYVLQIDSHMRFADGWDTKMLDELAGCPSARPMLTTYPWPYTPPRELSEGPPPRMIPQRFTDDGVLVTHTTWDADPALRATPAPHAFFAGGFACARAQALLEVPHDPYIYFLGTEVSQAARLWTHGWDFFAPTQSLVYHCYGAGRRKALHWENNSGWSRIAALSYRRLAHLLGAELVVDREALADLEQYGLGTVRSLEEYQEFAGVDFKARWIASSASERRADAGRRRPRERS